MDGIILIKPGSTLILQSMCAISKEELEKERSWLKEKNEFRCQNNKKHIRDKSGAGRWLKNLQKDFTIRKHGGDAEKRT